MNVSSANKRNKYSDQIVMLRKAKFHIEHLVNSEQSNSLKIKSTVYNKDLGTLAGLLKKYFVSSKTLPMHI